MAYMIIEDGEHSSITQVPDSCVDNYMTFKSLKQAKARLIRNLEREVHKLESAIDRIAVMRKSDTE